MQRITAEELPYAVERARFLFSITGFLALAVLAGTAMGVRIVRTRQDHAMLRTPWLLLLLAVFGLWSLALTVYGGWSLLASYSGWHLLPPAAAGRYWISLSLGLIGVYGTIGDLRYIKRPRPTPMAWWYRHMECMLGAGIGFHAAFFVFGASRLLKLHLQGVWQLLPWLLPFAIGVPAMMIWIRHYERKFEGAAS
ncbi:MAG TPA: hypothetical protein VNT79_01725, partial [Phycisphaerae bacterium]|nr:hypothetical protein [Phycisphaerae bacterium]